MVDLSSVPRLLLDAAQQDLSAATVLSQAPGLKDGVVGFHVQQAVEKALKAVLSSHGIAVRRTHDIAWLLDVLADAKGLAPPGSGWLDEFTPYAVHARYGGGEEGGLDRVLALKTATEVVQWAIAQIHTTGG